MSGKITVDCYNCSSKEHSHYLTENGFDLVKCSGCGVLYIRERPDDQLIEESTAVGQHHGDKVLDANAHYNPNVIQFYHKVLNDILPETPRDKTSWLDVGCGYGEFIEALNRYAKHELDVKGLEPNVHKSKHARDRGLDVTDFDLTEHEEQYDYVSLLNVYSHLPNPKEFITKLYKVTKNGGELIIQTGNAAELPADLMPLPACLPDHMTYTSEKILSKMLEDIGYEIVSVHLYQAFPMNPKKFLKEIVKFVSPYHDSYIRYTIQNRHYKHLNMYIRAKKP